MPFKLSVRTNIQSWDRKWRARQRVLESRTRAAPSTVAEWGANRAREMAPRDTTNLVQAISWRGTKKNNHAMIFVRRGFSNPKGGARATKYAGIMHRTSQGRARSIWKSGDPHFMFTVRNEASERFKRSLRSAVGKFLGKQP